MNEAEKEILQSVASVRELMVKHDTNYKHIKELLETNNKQTSEALKIAYGAKYESDKNKTEQKNLKWQINENKKEVSKINEKLTNKINKYQTDQTQEKRWAIGIIVAIGLAILPIVLNFYSNVVSGLQ